MSQPRLFFDIKLSLALFNFAIDPLFIFTKRALFQYFFFKNFGLILKSKYYIVLKIIMYFHRLLNSIFDILILNTGKSFPFLIKTLLLLNRILVRSY